MQSPDRATLDTAICRSKAQGQELKSIQIKPGSEAQEFLPADHTYFPAGQGTNTRSHCGKNYQVTVSCLNPHNRVMRWGHPPAHMRKAPGQAHSTAGMSREAHDAHAGQKLSTGDGCSTLWAQTPPAA